MRCVRIQGLVRAPVVLTPLGKTDVTSDAAKPVPAVGLNLAKPGVAIPGVGDNQRLRSRWKYIGEFSKKLVMTAGRIVIIPREGSLIQRDRASFKHDGSPERHQTQLLANIGPIHENDRHGIMATQVIGMPAQQCKAVVGEARVTEQTVDAFNAVFSRSGAANAAPELGQG